MKILILALPRTGSTSLLRKIKKQKYIGFFEPYGLPAKKKYNYPYPLKELSENKNIVVKQMICDIPNVKDFPIEFFPHPHVNPTLYVLQQYDFTKYFDKVILLDRKDTIEHLESYIHVLYKLDKKESVHSKWQKNDVPKEWTENIIKENKHNQFYIMKSEILLLSKKLNIDITWYEDLFGNDRKRSLDIIKSWNLDLDSNQLNEDLHPKNKYLIESKTLL